MKEANIKLVEVRRNLNKVIDSFICPKVAAMVMDRLKKNNPTSKYKIIEY